MVDQPDKQPVSPDDESPEKPVGWHEPPIPEGSSRPVITETWFVPENAAQIEEETAPGTDGEQPAAVLPDGDAARTGTWYAPIDARLDALLSGAADTIIEYHEPGPDSAQEAPPDERARQPVVSASARAALDEGWAISPSEAADDEDEATHILSRDEEEATEGTPESVDTAIAAEEPSVSAESTPAGQATPVLPGRPGLTPAEAAFLAEQRAADEQPTGEQAILQDTATDGGTNVPQPSEMVQARVPSRFDEVERKVKVLRQRYEAGALTRDQLQQELRTLMFQDEDGHWWMLGLETNRWYFFDGRDWVAADPPRDEEPVQSSGVPTETGMQEVVVDSSGLGQPQRPYDIELDEEGMPLPARVPQDDPSATLVSPSAPFMEPLRRSDAPTRSKSRQVETEVDTSGFVAHPAGDDQFTQPSRPIGEPAPGEGATIRSDRVMAGQAGAQDMTVMQPGQAASIPVPPAKPKYQIGEFPQPDYSDAYGTRNRNTYVRWAIRLVVFGTILTMGMTLVALLLMVGYYFYKVNQYQDVVSNLSARTSNFETTVIMDSQGTTLAEFNSPETGARIEVPLDKISPWLIHATVSTENETFYSDPGFSVVAILRATIQNVRAGDTVSGASTITQQLARALVLETEFASERTTERKIVEIIVASEIKRQYTKNEILQIYLNEIFYGNRAYGIEAAAHTYFGIPASDLNPAQAAFLAGLPQSPAIYDPVVNREAAMTRMKTVLRLMAEANGTGCISIQHADTTEWAVPDGGTLCVIAEEQPNGNIKYYYTDPGHPEPQEMAIDIARVETAPFKPPEFQATHPHFVNYVWQQLEKEYGSQAIYSAGFRVITTLDERIQAASEKAVTDNLNSLRSRGNDIENASVVVMKPTTGEVVAMVGSADYYNDNIDGQVNVAFTAQQPGSAMKPLIYLAAFQPNAQGQYWTPATVIWDVYTDFNGYIPENFDDLYHGPKTAREALANSLNIPAVKTLEYVGLERYTAFAQEAGLTFPLGNPIELNAGLTTALGAVEVRLVDMVDAYAMLANNGRRVDPVSIRRIEDSKGNLVYEAPSNPSSTEVVKPEYAYLITSILADNQARTQEFNPGWPLELQNGRVAAVKTGTSNDSRDLWTLGYTPQYVVGVWVGNTDNRPAYGLWGSTAAAPIWNQIMEEAHAGQPVIQFVRPPGIIDVEVCNDSGTRPSPACAGRTHWEIFTNSTPPLGPEYDIFRTLQVDTYTGKLVNEYCPDEPETRTFLAIDDPTAYNWINNTPDGNNWAIQRGLQPPIQPPPTEYCSPDEPRPNVIVSFPAQDMTVEGVVPLRGLISMPNFSRYEIRVAASQEPQAQDFQLLDVQQTQWPEPDSILGQVDTRALPNGPYTIRLAVIDVYGRSVHRDIRIMVNNVQPTALPTPTFAPTLTSPPGAAMTPIPGGVFPTPTLAPTLTPTWTLTPTPG